MENTDKKYSIEKDKAYSIETDKSYSIERLDAGRLKDLEDLHALVYGMPPAPYHFRKKYNTSYTGLEYVGYIAYNPDGVPLAYYGVMPCLIQYKDDIILSAQSGDTMTNPNYRYKGLFVELSTVTFALCRTLGIKFIFGFPNQNSYHGAVQRLGWQMTHTMQHFTIPVATLPAESLSNRLKWTKSIYRKYVRRVLDKYTLPLAGLSNALIAEGYGGIFRDAPYLQYRTYSPARVIKIGEAKAWITIRGGLIIGDLQVGKSHFEETIVVLRKLARRLGLSRISFQVSPGTALHALFTANYEAEPSFPVLFQDFGSPIPLEEVRFTFSDIDIF